MMCPPMFLHLELSALALFQSTQLNLFERFLTQAVSGIDSTSITSGMQNVAYVVLVVGFLWQVYQSVLHGGDVRGLGTNLVKYVATAVVVMNYGPVFTTLNQGFVNAGNWISSASGSVNLFQNWSSDLQTQYSQGGYQQAWGLITGSLAGLLDAILIIVAYLLYPVVIVIFGFFYIFYGSVLYIFGPIVIALMPLGAANRLAKAYVENVFIWNAWPILYGGFGALLSAVQMGQVGQMLNQNNFLGGLGNLEGSFLIGLTSIIYSLAIAVIPFIAKRIVSGDVGGTATTLIGAAAAAVTAGAAAMEGIGAGAAAAGAGTGGASGAGTAGAHRALTDSASSRGVAVAGVGNQPAPVQRSGNSGTSRPGSVHDNQSSMGASGGGDHAENVGSGPAGSVSSDVSPLSGTGGSAGGPSPVSAEEQAAEIRANLASAMNPSRSTATASAGGGKTADGGKGMASPRTSNQNGSARGRGSGGPGFGPGARRIGLATWGAYHAARLASYGVVAGGSAVRTAAGKLTEASTDPVRTVGNLAGSAGRVAGSVTNAALNTSRTAQSVARALSHPSETAERGAQAIGGVVSGTAKHLAETASGSVNEAKAQFSDAYGKKRRENERQP